MQRALPLNNRASRNGFERGHLQSQVSVGNLGQLCLLREATLGPLGALGPKRFRRHDLVVQLRSVCGVGQREVTAWCSSVGVCVVPLMPWKLSTADGYEYSTASRYEK